MADWISQYFIQPIEQNAGYNIINTLVFAVVLLGLSFWVIYPQLSRRGVKFDPKFAMAVVPYIVFGSALRVLEDLHVFPRSATPLSPWFYVITPGIYIFVGLLAIAALLVSRTVSKRMGWNALNAFRNIGIAFALVPLALDLANFKLWIPFIGILLMASAISMALIWVLRKQKGGFAQNPLAHLALFAQVLDGSATFTALQFYSCSEEHVVSRAITNASPVLFLLVKIAVVLVVLYYLKKEVKDENLLGFLYLLVMILGLAPGLRDTITIAVGTCL